MTHLFFPMLYFHYILLFIAHRIKIATLLFSESFYLHIDVLLVGMKWVDLNNEIWNRY